MQAVCERKRKMKLQIIAGEWSVCKVSFDSCAVAQQPFTFVARTDEELSVVCPTEFAPASAIAREDGWKAFRIEGELDFGLIGILARIASVLAENGIPIFAVSTYHTDYVLVKKEKFDTALQALCEAGYECQIISKEER